MPTRKGRNVRRSVTWIWHPPQSVLACLWNVGSKKTGLNHTPGSARWLSASARRSPSIHGAPMSSKGRVVPRPSDRCVPSNSTAPGYTMAVSSVGMFGDGRTHGRPVASKYDRPLPAFHRDDVHGRVEAEVIVEEPGGFADRQPVPHRDRKLTDEGRIGGVEGRAFDVFAVDRVGPIADDDADPVPSSRAKAVRHRIDVGVDPGADVLQVHHQDVHVGQHLRRRFARLAVERMDRQPAPGVARVRRLDHVLLEVRAKAVLGAEERRQRPVAAGGQPIGRMDEGSIDRRRIADESDLLPLDQFAVGTVEQTIES